MGRDAVLAPLRELVRCYQAFESYSARHVRAMGLTPAQFDIIATLGSTQGLSFKDLGAKTLITKGTLTGVVERLVRRKLVRKVASETDRRSQTVVLTKVGEAAFERSFPAHLAHLRAAFDRLSSDDVAQAEALLGRMRRAFEQGAAAPGGGPRRG